MLEKDDPRLTAYVLGELDEAERAEVEAAVAASAELQHEVAEIRRASQLLSEHLPGAPCPELTRAQREEIQRESVGANPFAEQSALPRRGALRPIIGAVVFVAASLLVAALLFHDRLPLQIAKNTDSAAVESAWNAPPMGAMPEESATRGADEYTDSLDMETSEYGYSNENPRSTAAPAADDAWAGDYGSAAEEDMEEGYGEMGGYGGYGGDDYGAIANDADPSGGYMGSAGPQTEPAHPFGNEDEYGDDGGYGGGYDGVPSPPADVTAEPGGYDDSNMAVRVARPAQLPTAPTESPAPEPVVDQAADEPFDGDRDWSEDEAETHDPFSNTDREPSDSPAESAVASPMRADVPGDGQANDGRGSGEGQGQAGAAGGGRGEADEGREQSNESGEAEDASSPSSNSQSGSGQQAGNKNQGKGKQGENRSTTWRRSAAVPNASRLMVGDRDDLPLEGMQVNVMVDGFRARVLMDLYYYNNRGQQLEGSFKLRLPDEASLYYFAFGQTSFQYRPMVDSLATRGFLTPELVRASGTGPQEILQARSETWRNVKEARVVPRAKAAHAYSETVRRRVDPALVEWSGPGVFNAKVFPLMPNQLHRIVVGYDVNLKQDGPDLTYQLDLPQDVSQCSVDLDVSALPGASAEVSPAVRPFVSGGRAFYHFDDPAVKSVAVRLNSPGVLMLTGADEGAGEFFATRITPQLPADESTAGASHAVFLVDTSLSSNPDKFNVWLSMLEAVLEQNRDEMKQFAVLFFNIESHWWQEGFVKNTPSNVNKLLNDASSLALEGATDLRQALAEAVQPSWLAADQKSPAYDLFLLSDGAATWGETDVRAVARVLQSGSGSLFAYKTGLTGTAIGHLEHLARETGGAVFSVASEAEVQTAATAHRTRPWKLLNLAIDGAEDVLIAGRPNYVYPGQSLTIVGRGLPSSELFLHLGRGDEKKLLQIPVDEVIPSDLSARLYGQVAVGQLEDLGQSIEDVSVAYARHFRVTGKTCSLLMLESEADYQRFNIRPEDDQFVIKSSPADQLILRMYDELAQTIDDPKEAMKVWLERMENMPGVEFQLPTALRLVLDRLPRESFDVEVPRLVCEQRELAGLPKPFFKQLDAEQLDYDVVSDEANRRFEKFGAADALKAVSNLIEKNPGDTVLSQDVAFSAIQWGLAGQAYPLLRRVADARPYQPHVYQALASCLAELGYADLAMIYYEVAVNGHWHERYQDFREIASVEYLHMLNRIEAGELKTQAPQFVAARQQSLADQITLDDADLVVTMMWNTDRTDVDLHVLEPTGEECYYKNRATRAGGQITRDVTEGFGPEMYRIIKARPGDYRIMANYYGSDANRTQVRTKVYVTVFEMFGKKQERVTRHTVTLSRGQEKRDLVTVTMGR